MKKLFSSLFVILLFFVANAQQLSQVTFTGASSLAYFTVKTTQDVLLRISQDGRLQEWGTEEQSQRYPGFYNPKLLPYAGRVEYYGPEADSASRGKVKNIGICTFTWYAYTEDKHRAGKLKTIGSLTLDYYNDFSNAMQSGKLKSIGNNTIDFYTSFDNESFRGKLKTAGPTTISYYSSSDDKLIKGKIKSIGSFNYTWYTSFDRSEYRGSLKSGNIRQLVNGVTYILW